MYGRGTKPDCGPGGTGLPSGELVTSYRQTSNDAVIKRTKELDMVSIPGAMTPTEIVHARDCGGDIVKLYIVDEI